MEKLKLLPSDVACLEEIAFNSKSAIHTPRVLRSILWKIVSFHVKKVLSSVSLKRKRQIHTYIPNTVLLSLRQSASQNRERTKVERKILQGCVPE